MKCAVITPIGPGHADLYQTDCLPSIEQAKAYSMGPFSEVIAMDMDDTKGEHGRSARRNEAIRQAKQKGIDWIFFLDADDFITPNAFEAFGADLEANPDLEAVWGLICELDGGEPTLREKQVAEINSYEELLGIHPFLSIQMGHFVKTDVAALYGFDESMDTGEDFKFYYQEWANHKCKKVPSIYFMNRRFMHSTGPRSATGADWSTVVVNLWIEKASQAPGRAYVHKDEKISAFTITNPYDLVQSMQTCGNFFEEELLDFLKEALGKPGAAIVDVGANIGNHVIYYGKHLNPSVIYPVEPNPEAIRIMDTNIALNDLEGLIDRRGVGIGVGKEKGSFSLASDTSDNMGATFLSADESGEIDVVPLDDLFESERIDFIKIDAEGMEFDVLAGAQKLIERNRPLIWIEVLKENTMQFVQKWCRKNNYKIIKNSHLANASDYFAAPKEK